MRYIQLLFTGVLSFFVLLCHAQKSYKIMPGENIKEVIPRSELYAYDQFEKGTIYFKNGRQSAALLNYSFLFGEFLFADRSGDTMALADPGEVKTAVIGTDYYYYAGGSRFVQRDTVIGEIILATAVFFKFGDKQRVSAYGMIDNNGGRDSYSTFDPPTGPRMTLTPQVVLTVSRNKALFIGTKYNQFVPVTKKSLNSFYSEKQNQLTEYLKNNKVNLLSRNDVINLIVYMNAQ